MEHAILGFLIDQPMHGYALKRALSPALPPEQRVNDGRLYPLLKRMEADGLISGRVERHEQRPDRRVFHPTAKGRRAFEEWLEGSDLEQDDVAYDFLIGHPFLTKCLFFGRLAPRAVSAKLESHLAESSAKLATFRKIRDGMVARRVDAYRIAVLDLGIAQQRQKIRWLKDLLREVEASRSKRRAA
jgi:DNA-binding PadR family transcriptional regulator